LQKLVSPFGKVWKQNLYSSLLFVFFSVAMLFDPSAPVSFVQTDTASVLQEASGYIKFLHEQIQVLAGNDFHFFHVHFTICIHIFLLVLIYVDMCL
jgi:hypothetical protein